MKLLEKPKFTTAHSRAGTKRALLGCAGHLLGGFVLSVGAVAGGCSPFAWHWWRCPGGGSFLFSALGAGLGYMIFGTGTARVRYFAAVLIALEARWQWLPFSHGEMPGCPWRCLVWRWG